MKPPEAVRRADGTTGFRCEAGHVHDYMAEATLCDLLPRAPEKLARPLSDGEAPFRSYDNREPGHG